MATGWDRIWYAVAGIVTVSAAVMLGMFFLSECTVPRASGLELYDVATVTASTDTYLADPPDNTTNYSTETTVVVGVVSPGVLRRGAYIFDVSALSKAVLSCTLRLYVAEPSASANEGTVYRLIGHIVDSQVSWSYRETAILWTKAGGDIDENLYVDFTMPTVGGWLEIDVTEICQDAQDNRSGALRFLIKAKTSSTGYMEFISLENDPDYAPEVVVVEGREPPFEPVEGDSYTPGAIEGGIHTRGAIEGEVD